MNTKEEIDLFTKSSANIFMQESVCQYINELCCNDEHFEPSQENKNMIISAFNAGICFFIAKLNSMIGLGPEITITFVNNMHKLAEKRIDNKFKSFKETLNIKHQSKD